MSAALFLGAFGFSIDAARHGAEVLPCRTSDGSATMPDMASGIEISPGISEATRKTNDLMHKLHLDWFGAAIKSLAKGATMIITVDGVRREEQWSGTHFVALEPGVHELELEWDSHTIGGHSLAPLKQAITVEPGRVTELVYTVQTLLSHGPPAASLEIKGTRAA